MLPLLLLSLAFTAKGTLTVEGPDGAVLPVASAVVYTETGAPLNKKAAAPITITCTSSAVLPSVLAIAVGTPVRVSSDHAGMASVRVTGADGLPILSASLVSRGQQTPTIRLPKGRTRIACTTASITHHASVLVLVHNTFTQTTQAGAFALEAEGERATVYAWHPELGLEVRVLTATVSFETPLF